MDFADLPNELILDLFEPYVFLTKNLDNSEIFCIDIESIIDSILTVLMDVQSKEENIADYLEWLIYEGLDVKSDTPKEQIQFAISVIEESIRKILCVLNILGYSSLKEFPYMFRYIRPDGTTYLSKVPTTQLL